MLLLKQEYIEKTYSNTKLIGEIAKEMSYNYTTVWRWFEPSKEKSIALTNINVLNILSGYYSVSIKDLTYEHH